MRLLPQRTSSLATALAALVAISHTHSHTHVSALYFHVTQGGQPRCFIEEVPSETLIVGTYKNPDFVAFGEPNFSGAGLKVTIQDHTRTQVFMNKNLDKEGRFAFTTPTSGEWFLCFSTNSSTTSRPPRKYRLDLKLDIGETGIDYAEVARREHLSDLEIEVRRLVDKLKDIMKEQLYQREREVAFRATSEGTHAKVQYVSLLQVVVMLASGIWQITTLKAFFSRKKIA